MSKRIWAAAFTSAKVQTRRQRRLHKAVSASMLLPTDYDLVCSFLYIEEHLRLASSCVAYRRMSERPGAWVRMEMRCTSGLVRSKQQERAIINFLVSKVSLHTRVLVPGSKFPGFLEGRHDAVVAKLARLEHLKAPSALKLRNDDREAAKYVHVPVACHSSLKQLTFYRIVRPKNFSTFTALKVLNFEFCGVDMSRVCLAPNLEELSITAGVVIKFGTVARFKKLTTLRLISSNCDHACIQDILACKTITSIEESASDICYHHATSTMRTDLTNLSVYPFCGLDVDHLDYIRELKNLECLIIKRAAFTILVEYFMQCKALRWLSLQSSRLDSYAPLTKLQNLQVLDIRGRGIPLPAPDFSVFANSNIEVVIAWDYSLYHSTLFEDQVKCDTAFVASLPKLKLLVVPKKLATHYTVPEGCQVIHSYRLGIQRAKQLTGLTFPQTDD